MRLQFATSLFLSMVLAAISNASPFSVNINGMAVPITPGATSVNIAGTYGNVTISDLSPTQRATVSFSDDEFVDLLILRDTVLTLDSGGPARVVIGFEHTFAGGPDGTLEARQSVSGVFMDTPPDNLLTVISRAGFGPGSTPPPFLLNFIDFSLPGMTPDPFAETQRTGFTVSGPRTLQAQVEGFLFTGDRIVFNEVALVVDIPEPSTLTLVSVATVGGLFYGWRRRKRAAPVCLP